MSNTEYRFRIFYCYLLEVFRVPRVLEVSGIYLHQPD